MTKKKKTSMKEKIRQKAARASSGGKDWLNLPAGVEFFKPESKKKSVKYEFSILAYIVKSKNHPEAEKGDEWYQRSVHLHYVGPPNSKTAVICPRMTFKKKCPICEEYDRLMLDPDVDEDELKELKPKHRELFNVLLKKEKDVRLFESSYHTFGKILLDEINDCDDENVEAFADHEGGMLLSVKFKKKTMGNNDYFELASVEFLDRNDISSKIKKQIIDLDSILVELTYDEINDIFTAGMDDDDEPKSKKKKKTKKSKINEIDEDEDDDEDDEDDEDEDDDEDDEDEDEDEDDDDEDDDEELEEDECAFGHKFPKDCNKHDDCDDCGNWYYCNEQKEALTKKKKKKKK